MRKIKITEKQMEHAISEGVNITADMTAAGNDPKRAVDNTRRQAQKSGIKPDDVNVLIPPENEGKIITKAQLQENRRNILRQNSKLYSVFDFMEKLNAR